MEAKHLRIVYMGTPAFAVGPLRALVEGGYNIAAVVTNPDKPAGRGQKLMVSPVKAYAVEKGLRILQPEKLKSPEFADELRELRPDVGVVVAFRMLPESVYGVPLLGTFNLHTSLLPQYRGAAPINWAIINGETQTGVTTFFLNDRMDEGVVIGQSQVSILPEDNAGSLHDKLMDAGSRLVVDTVERIAAGTAAGIKQRSVPGEELHPAPKIFKETCRVDFATPGEKIVNLIRGLSPYPTAWAELRKIGGAEGQVVKIFAAAFKPGRPASYDEGAIISDEKSFLKVVCADGTVDITDLQLAGKKRMTAVEFLKGFRGIGDFSFS